MADVLHADAKQDEWPIVENLKRFADKIHFLTYSLPSKENRQPVLLKATAVKAIMANRDPIRSDAFNLGVQVS